MPWIIAVVTFTQAMCGQIETPQAKWDAYYQRVAETYALKLAGDGLAPLELAPRPIHKYAHPLGLAGTQGAFFVWLRQGRPEVVGSIWSYEHGADKRSVVHEFHSLALQPLAPVQVGDHLWRPKGAGVELQPVPAAAIPSVNLQANRRLRLIQMRNLAAQFTGFSTPEGKELRLRLLEHPAYRYGQDQELAAPVIDGGLFVLFNEWDPEILLAIEAREGPGGARWYFAAARFNICPLRLEHAGRTVWQAGQGSQQGARFGDPEGPFFAVHAVELLERGAPPE